uniref:Uncharacterized protein n=1 Tax=Nothoprocta perdicaria TaxID=30464 RepID=A0A8C6ZIF7_NOTPE
MSWEAGGDPTLAAPAGGSSEPPVVPELICASGADLHWVAPVFPHLTPLFPSIADCQAMVNLHCRLLILVAHLKRKCQCRPEGNCSGAAFTSGWMFFLQERHSRGWQRAYGELQMPKVKGAQTSPLDLSITLHRKEDTESTCYESLLENLGKHYPELAGKSHNQRRSPGPTQRRAQSHSTPARPRATPQRRSSELRGAPR